MRSTLLLWLVALVAEAAPSTPRQVKPIDGGWTPRPPQLMATTSPWPPLDAVSFEFEVQSPLGVTSSLGVVAVDPTSATNGVVRHPPSPPDAGAHWWRVRALDALDAGSPWSELDWFQIDDQPPPYPPSITVAAQDGGFVHLTWSPVVDTQSGVDEYHLIVGQLDPPDGGVGAMASGPATGLSTVGLLRLGSGVWNVGVHAHDAVENTLAGSGAWALVVVPSPTLPAPGAPLVVRSDGGPWPTAPYQNVNTVRLRLDAGFAASGYSVIESASDSGVWLFVASTPSSAVSAWEGEGPREFRFAALAGQDVSEWSAPVHVHVDTTRPRAPPWVDGGLDGGVVELTWGAGVDPSSTASGLARYRVLREGADASVEVAVVPAEDPRVVTDAPPEGTWRYRVYAEDRAANLSLDAGLVEVELPLVRIEVPAGDAVACGRPAVVTLTASGDGPVVWSLPDLPAEASIDSASGALTFTPPVGATTWVVRVRAAAPHGQAEATVTIPVHCDRVRLTMGCGCHAASSALAPLLLLLFARLAGLRRRGPARL